MRAAVVLLGLIGPVVLGVWITMRGPGLAEAGALMLFIGWAVMIPPIIAALRGHHNTLAITALSILLGWTVLGWIAAFVWSLTAKRPADG